MKLAKEHKLWSGIVVVLVVIVAAMYFFTSDSQQEDVTVRIAISKLVGGLPIFVALDQGLIKERGVDYQYDEFATASLVTDSLLAGKHDVGGPMGSPDIILLESKNPGHFKIFSAFAETSESHVSQIVVKKGSPMTSIEQLAGKKVAVGPGLTPDFLAKSFFREMNVSSVEIVVINPGLWIQALASGQVDAVYMIEPLATIAIESGVGRSIFSGAEVAVIDPMPIVSFAFTSEFASLHEAEAYRIVSAVDKSVEIIEDDPESARASLSKIAGIPANVTGKIILGKSYDSKSVRSLAPMLQEMADMMYEMGYTDKKVDVSAMFYK